MDFPNEVKAPLLKRSKNHHRLQRKIFELMLSRKLLAFDTRSNICKNISKKARPEIPSFEDLIGYVSPKMTAPR
jgi:hypothetical protein